MLLSRLGFYKIKSEIARKSVITIINLTILGKKRNLTLLQKSFENAGLIHISCEQ